MIRNSSKTQESRELSAGERQPDEDYELTFEQPAEGITCEVTVMRLDNGDAGEILGRFGRSFRRKREKACQC